MCIKLQVNFHHLTRELVDRDREERLGSGDQSTTGSPEYVNLQLLLNCLSANQRTSNLELAWISAKGVVIPGFILIRLPSTRTS